MKTPRAFQSKRGFTLIELLVAMTITTVIVGVLVSVTAIAMDTWNRSRSELRASRQAKTMIDTMARDFESLVSRKGNTSEWLSVVTDADLANIGDNMKSTNAAKLVFFTAATDRYNGEIGVPTVDKGGDVSCVAYQLKYRDSINDTGTLKTFVLNRLLVNPDETFSGPLGKTDSNDPLKSLDRVFFGDPTNPTDSTFEVELAKPKNFLCENVFQFSVIFHVQVIDSTQAPPVTKYVPVKISSGGTSSFRILGTGIATLPVDAQVASGRVTAIEFSVTVLSDSGVEQAKKRTFTAGSGKTVEQVKAEFLAKNSYQYSKLVQLSSM
jgi:prepilin-type N-terminal cleavage/methylation domain-containing protein